MEEIFVVMALSSLPSLPSVGEAETHISAESVHVEYNDAKRRLWETANEYDNLPNVVIKRDYLRDRFQVCNTQTGAEKIFSVQRAYIDLYKVKF